MPRAADPSAPTVDAPTQNLVGLRLCHVALFSRGLAALVGASDAAEHAIASR
jgi:hypothetical protein